MKSWLAYIAYRAAETVLRVMPMSLAWRTGAGLGLLGHALSGRYRKLVRRNLTIAFGGELSPEKIKALAREHFRTLGGNFFTSMKMPFLKPEEAGRHLEIEGIDRVKTALAEGRGIVYVLMHMGNWELLTQAAIIAPGSSAGGIYQPLHNKLLDAHVLRSRQRSGSKLFDRKAGYNAAVTFLRSNKVLAVLADQRAGGSGVWCPFFGRLASTTTLPALLAKRAGAPMMPVGVITTGPGRWKMVVGETLPGVSRDLSPEQAAAIMNEALEKIIRRSPADWFWVHNRWKTPNPEILLANAKRGLSLAPGWQVENLKAFEIVIRSPDTLSDACLSIPAVRALRRGRPDARVTMLTPEKLADLWKMEAEIDEVLPFPENATPSAVAAALKATGRSYDAGILFTTTRSAAVELRKAGVQRIAGYEGENRKRLLDQIIPPKKKAGPVQHRSREFLRIAWRLGANVDDPTLHDPLELAVPKLKTKKVLIGLCPGGEHGAAQRWPLERWGEAVKQASADLNAHFVIFGTAAEAELGAKLVELAGKGRCTDLTGKTTLAELATRLRGCRVVFGHDSGPIHLAALLGVPTVTVFGPTEAAHTAPMGPAHTFIRRHVECSPCFLAECPMDHRCMLEIPAGRVAAAMLRHSRSTAAV